MKTIVATATSCTFEGKPDQTFTTLHTDIYNIMDDAKEAVVRLIRSVITDDTPHTIEKLSLDGRECMIKYVNNTTPKEYVTMLMTIIPCQ